MAFKRYKDAKADYEALLAKKAAIQATVDTYNQDAYNIDPGTRTTPNTFMPGVNISTTVTISPAKKGLYKAFMSVVLSNTSENNYLLSFIHGSFYLIGDTQEDFWNAGYWGFMSNGKQVTLQDMQVQNTKPGVIPGTVANPKAMELKAGETLCVDLPSFLLEPDNRLRKMLLQHRIGAMSITPPVKIENVIKSNVTIVWSGGTEELLMRPGVLSWTGGGVNGI